jgi:hypothetical protein
MKTTLPLLIIVLSSQVLAEGYFPLHKGNLWQYQSTDLQSPDRWETLILGDTVLPNGKTYAQFNQTNFSSRFLRQDGSKVFAYSQIDSAEFLLFDFAANPGDTITRFQHQQWRIVLQGIYPFAYQGHTTWVFLMLTGTGPGSYDFLDWWITDSLGLTHMIGEPGITYNVTGMRIDGVTYGTILGVQSPSAPIPAISNLRQNYPNPFNPTTTISFDLARGGELTITVFNLLGQEVAMIAQGYYPAGTHSVTWNASGIPSGCYFYRMTATNFAGTRRLVLLR